MRKILILLIVSFISQWSFAEEELPAHIVEGMNRLKKKEGRYWNNKDWENHMRICHEFLVNYEQYLEDDKKAMWNVKIAGTFVELKSYLLAVEYLQKGIEYAEGPLKSFAHSQLGRSYIDLGEFDKAAESYKAALRTSADVERKVAHTNSLGFVYYQAGLYRDARNGTIYYRLTQVDTDGTATVLGSKGIQATCEDNIQPVVYPNPSTGQLNVYSPISGSVTLFDAQGRILKTITLKEGENVLSFDYLASGTYKASIQLDNGKFYREQWVKM